MPSVERVCYPVNASPETVERVQGMSVEAVYLLRKDQPALGMRELDDVVLLADVTTDDGMVVSAGTEGTIVSEWPERAAFEVEFAEPEGALATVAATILKRVGRQVP